MEPIYITQAEFNRMSDDEVAQLRDYKVVR